MRMEKKPKIEKLDRQDHELIQRVKSAWSRPELSADEKAAFNEELARRLEDRPRFSPLRLALATGVFALAVGFVWLIVMHQPDGPGKTGMTSSSSKKQVAHEAASDEPVTLASWLDSLTSPEPKEQFVAMLDPEYQAIAAWLSPEQHDNQ